MIQIIIKETKSFLRDTTNLFFYLIFPVVLVFLLGNLLTYMDKAEETIGKLRIHYSIETYDMADILAIEGFISEVEGHNIIFERRENLDDAIILAGSDDIDGAVLFTNSPMEIYIYEGSSRIKNRTINAIMNGFTQINKAVNIIVKTNPKALTAIADLSKSPELQQEFIEPKDLGVSRSMLDYYAITMLSMLCFMSVIIGAMCFMGEEENGTIHRLKIAPVNQVKLFFAKILGLIPQIFLQISILMVTSVFIFGAKYASNLIDNIYLLTLFFVVTFTIISIGAVYGLCININPMIIIFPLVWLIMFLGGTYSKELFIDGLTQALPTYKLQEAAFDIAIFGRYERANNIIIVCIIISIIMLILGALAVNRKVKK
ncbi:MAG: ABC transporter permease [Clostridiales bacterium]|nr:ABC transporter permease [Clostridiales bacterium]